MKDLLIRKENFFSPTYREEVVSLRSLILKNWWHNEEVYFTFFQKCKTSVGIMAEELGEVIRRYKSDELSEEKVIDKFRYILDLLDYYS